MIWFLSDNGGATNNASRNTPLAGHKGIKFEGGIRVPCLLHWPRELSPTRESRMVSSLDILPTCVAAANGTSHLRNDRPLDGVNLLPYLKSETSDAPHNQLFWHKLWFSAMRDNQWKLIWVQDYGYALYNLDEDIEEQYNLASLQPERVAAMSKQLTAWKTEMAQPLWGEDERWFKVHSQNHIRLIENPTSENK